MKIAVPYENELVSGHFGQTKTFAVFDIQDNRIVGMTLHPTDGTGHSKLTKLLIELKVDVLLAGGIGGCAIQALAPAGIKIVSGVSGDAIEAVGDYLKGELKTNPFSCSHHAGNKDDHGSCGSSCSGHCH